MLKITKITDYGFVILVDMVNQDPGILHNAKDLSQRIDIPLPTVSKVLKILTQGGILISHQGSKGGYSLAKPPEEIKALEIIEAVEGPIAFTDCSSEAGCERDCQVSPSWQRVNSEVVRTLSGLSLTDMSHG